MSTKKLFEILPEKGIEEIIGDHRQEITNLFLDSRRVVEGSGFIAVVGFTVDGHDYIDSAIDKGAAVIFVTAKPEILHPNITYVVYTDPKVFIGELAHRYFGKPSKELKLIGITGTNGKSSCVTMLYQLFQKLGYKTGLISTIENRIGGRRVKASHTTPDAVSLNELLSEMVESGCAYTFMEVSSHAIDQGRIAGLSYAGAVFTNITHDHLDYHKTFKEYIRVKKLLFDGLSNNAFALVNVDDKNGKVMLQNCDAQKYRFGLHHPCDYKGKILSNTIQGLHMDINGIQAFFSLSGKFNASNLLAVYGVADLLGISREELLVAMSSLSNAEGRFDKVIGNKEGIVGIVDYAHTPDALQNVISTIQEVKLPEVKLITVIGCGGNRDKEKRPIMAKIATRKSDTVILTNDNPRNEDPEEILDHMEVGIEKENINKVLRISDRKQAIKTACRLAQNHDIILVAGKGHEKYQEIKGKKFPFDDKKILQEELLGNI